MIRKDVWELLSNGTPCNCPGGSSLGKPTSEKPGYGEPGNQWVS